MTYITPTQHEKNEWSRMAQAAYNNGFNATGHRYSAFASMRSGQEIEITAYDTLARNYRAWLCFNEFPEVKA